MSPDRPGIDPRSDGGFTLVELLIGMAIGGLLISVLGGALVIGLRTTEEAGNQVHEAAWARIVLGWFLTDVHSAVTVGTDAPACEVVEGATFLATFGNPLDADSDPPTSNHVDWWLDLGILRRAICTSDDPATTTETIGEDLESASIICSADSCTLTWTVLLTDGAPNRTEEDRTYSSTVARRVR